jgi:adenosylmethionine-8-amino-7-oxononanoate aminotransferase
MTATLNQISTPAYQKTSDLNNWRHFAEMGGAAAKPPKVIVKGEGCYLIDSDGNRYLDGLSNLFCVNLGYSYGEELGEAALAQYKELGYHSNWGSTHPRAVELASVVADLAPADLNHVYFTHRAASRSRRRGRSPASTTSCAARTGGRRSRARPPTTGPHWARSR